MRTRLTEPLMNGSCFHLAFAFFKFVTLVLIDLFGFLTDTAESIQATIEYSIELDSTAALFKVLTPYPGTPLHKQMKPLITETDYEKFDGYTPTFQHPNLSHEVLRYLLASAYAKFYIRPSWALNYLGLGHMNIEPLQRLEGYTRRRQMEDDQAFFGPQLSKMSEP